MNEIETQDTRRVINKVSLLCVKIDLSDANLFPLYDAIANSTPSRLVAWYDLPNTASLVLHTAILDSLNHEVPRQFAYMVNASHDMPKFQNSAGSAPHKPEAPLIDTCLFAGDISSDLLRLCGALPSSKGSW